MISTAAPAQGITPTLVDDWQAVFSVDPDNPGFLERYNVERTEEIKLLGYAVTAGVDGLLLGDPGTGKTHLIELLLKCLHKAGDAELFDILLIKEMSADDVLGPRSLPALKEGRIERLIRGFLPTAHVAYVDEVFKAAPPLLNSLLDIMANRQFKIGGKKISVDQLILMLMSSNELPDREDLQPVRDRVAWTKYVQPVRTSEGRREVMEIQLGMQANGIDETTVPPLSLDSIRRMRAEANRVFVPDEIKEIADLAQVRWEKEMGTGPSQRRMGQMWKMAKSVAWAHGYTEVQSDHLMVWADLAWNHPDHAKPAREVIAEFASSFTRTIERMKVALEPVLGELDQVRARLEATKGNESTEDLEAGYEAMKNLKRMKRNVAKEMETGQSQGHDVSELQALTQRIEQAHAYIDTTLKDA